jgi:dihydroxy-acid dehydratase
MGGCDKTTPGLLMGAVSMDIPVIYCPAGPMLNDRYKGKTVGAGTHTKKFFDEYVAGNIDSKEWIQLESKMTRSPGTCNTMGTASTMTAMAEAMGFTLPGATSIPAKPSTFFTRASVDNALATYMALGGSTNAAIHTIAMAGRAGIALALDDFDAVAEKIPVLANLFPSGDKLMEDFFYAGGLPALLNEIRAHLQLDTQTVTGKSLGENIAGAQNLDPDVIRPLSNPVTAGRTLAVLRGNLCPDGAIIKPSAASAKFIKHRGRALVFDSNAEMLAKIHAPDLDVDENTVLVLRNAGPVGAPGMPEWGNLPIPKKLLQRGIRDMVRISDARMSGTHYGSCIVHAAPEAAIGGPLALVRDGDWIVLDVESRSLNVEISDAELARRRSEWKAPPRFTERGFTRLYVDHVTQADKGADFDFLMGTAKTPEPPIY